MAKSHIFAAFAFAAAPVAALAVSAFADSPPPPPTPTADHHNQCFARHNINGFQAVNDRTLYIRVGVKDIYRLDLMTACNGLTFHQAFALESQPATAFVCTPLSETVIIRDTGITQRCPVSAITKLTPDEVAALPKRDLP